MRHAYMEIENQTRKLKKRELLINQALKRLEALNTMKLGGGIIDINGNNEMNNGKNVNNESSMMMSSQILEGLTGLRSGGITGTNNNIHGNIGGGSGLPEEF